jgi:uncharacterized membrane protein
MNLTSNISQKEISSHEVVYGKDIRKEILAFVQKKYPDFHSESLMSLTELNDFRKLFLLELLEKEQGDHAHNHAKVMDDWVANKILVESAEKDTNATRGQRYADKIASFGGSWTFILLNLILSCMAAIQAPIIMMSQNRQEQKDRLQSQHDYQINLKAEMEIKLLNEKLDHLLLQQNKRWMEMQEVQMEYLEALMKMNRTDNSSQAHPAS